MASNLLRTALVLSLAAIFLRKTARRFKVFDNKISLYSFAPLLLSLLPFVVWLGLIWGLIPPQIIELYKTKIFIVLIILLVILFVLSVVTQNLVPNTGKPVMRFFFEWSILIVLIFLSELFRHLLMQLAQ